MPHSRHIERQPYILSSAFGRRTTRLGELLSYNNTIYNVRTVVEDVELIAGLIFAEESFAFLPVISRIKFCKIGVKNGRSEK